MPALAAAAGAAATPETVERMLAAAPHRGECHTTAVAGNTVVGVCRRADANDASVAHCDGFVAAVVGRLDNLAQLAQQVPSGPPPRTPAELLVALARSNGGRIDEAQLRQWRGVFAGVLGDGHRLYAFRDQLGFRSVFHRCDHSNVFVASEAKQVLAGAGRLPVADRAVVEQIFYSRYDDDTPSAFHGVQRLPKATLLVGGPGSLRQRRYWRPEVLLEATPVTPEELQERFDALMHQAVSRAITGRDAIALSGGVDSPAVAAYAAPEHLRLAQRPLLAITQVYPRFPAVDELPYVKIVTEALGIPLVTYEHDTKAFEGLERAVELIEGPTPTWSGDEISELCRQARGAGRTTVLTGELAEFHTDLNRNLFGHLLLHGRFRAVGRRMLAQRRAGLSMSGLLRQLASPFVPAAAARLAYRRGLFYQSLPVPAWLDEGRVDVVPRMYSFPARERWLQDQLGGFVGPGLSLEAEEIQTDVEGVTLRRPFGDVDLWEFFLGLPAEQKVPMPGRKPLLRALLRGRVPDAILDRRTKTFFDDEVLANIDYDSLRFWTIEQRQDIGGVDYDNLADSLERRSLDLVGYVWARDLAVAQAFLARWDGAEKRTETTDSW